MENNDRELILKVIKENKALRRLYDRHVELDKQVSSFDGRGFLTTAEELELRRLKKRKLLGVDEMMNIISPLREAANE